MRGNFNKYFGETNPNYKDGRKGTRLYRIYRNMLSRCNNPRVRSYARYGGRGIIVCKEWKDNFSTFRDWALSNGYNDELTLDRINNEGNYEPDNCRWATYQEQSLNTSRNHLVQLFGEIRPLDEWCRIYQLNSKTVRDRLTRGWNYEKALTTPVDRRWSH